MHHRVFVSLVDDRHLVFSHFSLLTIVFDAELRRLECVLEDKACYVTHNFHSVHRQDLSLVV